MTFTPVNNYLYVKAIEDKDEEESAILLPGDYRPVENPFAVVEVVTSTLWAQGMRVAVEAHMLRDIQHNGETYTVIKENHVIGILSENP